MGDRTFRSDNGLFCSELPLVFVDLVSLDSSVLQACRAVGTTLVDLRTPGMLAGGAGIVLGLLALRPSLVLAQLVLGLYWLQ